MINQHLDVCRVRINDAGTRGFGARRQRRGEQDKVAWGEGGRAAVDRQQRSVVPVLGRWQREWPSHAPNVFALHGLP